MNKLNGNSILELKDGAKIAVLGGGPAGSFFSIFALKLAKQIGKDIDLIVTRNLAIYRKYWSHIQNLI